MTATIERDKITFPCPCCGKEVSWKLSERPGGMLTRASRLKHLGRDMGPCPSCGKLIELVETK